MKFVKTLQKMLKQGLMLQVVNYIELDRGVPKGKK